MNGCIQIRIQLSHIFHIRHCLAQLYSVQIAGRLVIQFISRCHIGEDIGSGESLHCRLKQLHVLTDQRLCVRAGVLNKQVIRVNGATVNIHIGELTGGALAVHHLAAGTAGRAVDQAL